MLRKIWLISGDRRSGKTNFCAAVAQRLTSAGIDVSGLLSPGVFLNGRKVGIDAIDLRTNDRRRLANARPSEHAQLDALETRAWAFDADVMDWGNEQLRAAVPTDVLIVDELGTLEFERDMGWLAGLEAVDSGQYKAALVVIRPELIDKARERWSEAQVIDVELPPYSSIEDLVNELVRAARTDGDSTFAEEG